MRQVILNRYDLIELSESILSRHGCFRFEARGSSMYPFIRSGDVLTVQPTHAAALNVGDVAFYRAAGDRAVAHRVLRKSVQDNHIVLTMRGDAASGPGERILARDVLGQVVSIQRGRKVIRVDQGFRRLVALLWANSQPLGGLLFRLPEMVRCIASRLPWYLRRLRFYRSWREIGDLGHPNPS